MQESITYFELRGYQVFADLNEVVVDGEREKLTPKEMEVLLVLYQNMGSTVTRHTLLESVWGTRYANDLGLTQAISRLRQLFKDDHKRPLFIRTVPKKGYQLIEQSDEEQQVKKAGPAQMGQRGFVVSRRTLLLLMLLLTILLTILFLTKDVRIRIGRELAFLQS